jgi:RNA polymerase sigma-70 factor, ECF subfamily
MRRLRRSMEMLTPQQRECILLRASGLRYREIAEVLGIGISSVGETMQRAASRLKTRLYE